jgi:hypothetical protein
MKISHPKLFPKRCNLRLLPLLLFLIWMGFPFPINGSVLPQDFDFSRYNEWLLDHGELWQSNSMFHPLNVDIADTSVWTSEKDWVTQQWLAHSDRMRELRDSESGRLRLLAYTGVGVTQQTGHILKYKTLAIQPYFWLQTEVGRGFYTRSYIRATNQPLSMEHYAGSTGQSRVGFNSYEIDQSVIGFDRRDFTVEFGRAREIWGPLNDENLLLSGSAPSYDRLVIDLKYRKLRARWFYGFLDAIPLKHDSGIFVQRYIVGRGIQYSNASDLVIGLAEVSILTGINRPMDWSFFNPLALHLEIEQNDRSNNPKNYTNAIWLLSVDKRLGSYFRLSGSFILDEIKLDRSELNKYPDMFGYQGRIAWSKNSVFGWNTLYSSYGKTDTYTYQHTSGYANWVTRNQFLGYLLGNDADEFQIGDQFMPVSIPAAFEVTYQQQRKGGNSLAIDDRYYYSYYKQHVGSFPSGNVNWQSSISLSLHYEPKPWLILDVTHVKTLEKSQNMDAYSLWTFKTRIQIPFML